MRCRSRRFGGFTLIELMIVVAIVAILAAIAIPAYSRYSFRARRTDAQTLLLSIANAEERYYALNNKYADLATIGYSSTTTATSSNSYYTAVVSVTTVNSLTSQGFTATATPQGVQAKDQCAALSITNTGVKAYTGNSNNGNCWG